LMSFDHVAPRQVQAARRDEAATNPTVRVTEVIYHEKDR
jgi:hypothetical protein